MTGIDGVNWEELEPVFIAHINKYGFDKQVTVLGEEAVELAKVVFKIKRAKENNDSEDYAADFHEEYIDLLIMMKQFEYYIDDTLFDCIFNEKIDRAKKRVDLL